MKINTIIHSVAALFIIASVVGHDITPLYLLLPHRQIELVDIAKQTPALKPMLSIMYRRSGDMAIGPIQLKHDHDTVHFYKRTYSDNFRVYQLQFDQEHYRLLSVTITGYRGKTKLYTTPAPLTSARSGIEFLDKQVNAKENRLTLEAQFEGVKIKEQKRWTVHVVLDKEW